jgi:hypothetical protein
MSRIDFEKTLDKIDLSNFLSGYVCVQYRKCGKPNCRCARGEKHGPYYYLSWREGGKQCWNYIKKQDLPRIQEACANNRVLQAYLRFNREEHKQLFRDFISLLRLLERKP